MPCINSNPCFRPQRLRLCILLIIAGFALFTLRQAQAQHYAFAVLGDVPYSTYEREQLPGMLSAIADSGAAFAIHVGDIKGGQQRCDDSLYQDRRHLFDQSRIPFVLVAGDNEWTDCHRLSNGAYDPLERLQRLRQIFWSEPHSLGQKKLPLIRQSAAYPEHSRFVRGPVLFLTLNIPGGDNNYGRGSQPSAEFLVRNPQALAWLKAGFALARSQSLRGVVVLLQANPSFKHDRQGLPHAGFRALLDTLRDEAAAFQGETLLVHGDTHWNRVDHPLRDKTGQPMPRFTRIETHGYPIMGWTRVLVDPDAPQLFQIQPHPWPEP